VSEAGGGASNEAGGGTGGEGSASDEPHAARGESERSERTPSPVTSRSRRAREASEASPDVDSGASGEAGGGASGEAKRSRRAREASEASPNVDGEVVVRADLLGTLIFAITAAAAAIFFTTVWQWIAAVTALVLFALGVFAFLWSYYNAVLRSRRDEISVTALYLLLGPATPPPVRRTMLGALAIQVAVAVATTFARLETADGSQGSSLALGFLVPMFGFGLNGLWAAYHGAFPPRAAGTPTGDRRSSVPE